MRYWTAALPPFFLPSFHISLLCFSSSYLLPLLGCVSQKRCWPTTMVKWCSLSFSTVSFHRYHGGCSATLSGNTAHTDHCFAFLSSYFPSFLPSLFLLPFLPSLLPSFSLPTSLPSFPPSFLLSSYFPSFSPCFLPSRLSRIPPCVFSSNVAFHLQETGPDADTCAVCIDAYKAGDVLSILTCKYVKQSFALMKWVLTVLR